MFLLVQAQPIEPHGDMMEQVDMTALEAVGRNTVGAHIPLSPPYGAII